MKKQLIGGMIVALAMASSGCSTIIHGSHDQVKIYSKEAGSSLYVNNKEVGKDSVEVPLRRGKISELRASKPGCEDARANSDVFFDATTLLGIFIDLGIVTVTTDIATGNAYRVDPLEYELNPQCPNK